LNQREFRESGDVSRKGWPSLRPNNNKAVRSSDARLPSSLPSTPCLGRLTECSHTARQYNINVTEANVCQLGGHPAPISAQPTSGLSHLRTPEPRGLLRFFSTGVGRLAPARQTLVRTQWGRRFLSGQCLGGRLDVIRAYAVVAGSWYRGWMRRSDGPLETGLAAHEPPI